MPYYSAIKESIQKKKLKACINNCLNSLYINFLNFTLVKNRLLVVFLNNSRSAIFLYTNKFFSNRYERFINSLVRRDIYL